MQIVTVALRGELQETQLTVKSGEHVCKNSLVENLPKIQAEPEVFIQEYVELGIRPVAGGTVYRFASSLSHGSGAEYS